MDLNKMAQSATGYVHLCFFAHHLHTPQVVRIYIWSILLIAGKSERENEETRTFLKLAILDMPIWKNIDSEHKNNKYYYSLRMWNHIDKQTYWGYVLVISPNITYMIVYDWINLNNK